MALIYPAGKAGKVERIVLSSTVNAREVAMKKSAQMDYELSE